MQEVADHIEHRGTHIAEELGAGTSIRTGVKGGLDPGIEGGRVVRRESS